MEKHVANELEAEVAAAVSNTTEVTEFNKNIDPIGQLRGGEIEDGTGLKVKNEVAIEVGHIKATRRFCYS